MPGRWPNSRVRCCRESLNFPPVDLDSPVEPTVGSDLLAHIVAQRDCEVKDNEVRPPEPLFLPIAEFEMELAGQTVPTVPAGGNRAQQQQQDFESGWVRPIVLTAGQPVPQAGPAPQPRATAFADRRVRTRSAGQALPAVLARRAAGATERLDFDTGWARPIVLQNLRIAA